MTEELVSGGTDVKEMKSNGDFVHLILSDNKIIPVPIAKRKSFLHSNP